MRIVFRLVVTLLLVSAMGCASTHAPQCEVGEKGGWQRLILQPANAGEILANAPAEERSLLLGSETVEWFERDDGAYLVCIPGRKPVCGQTNYHIEKTEDGWARPFHYGISCP